MSKPKREELIEMVKQIRAMSACVSDFDGLMNQIEKQSGSKEIGRLIFDPPDGRPLSAEEVVDRVLGNEDS